MKAQSFPKSIRLRKETDFVELTQKGKRRRGKFVTTVVLERPETIGIREGTVKKPAVRVAVVVSKRIGNAVVRNGWKRRVRAIFRTLKRDLPLFAQSRDIMIMVRQPGKVPLTSQLKSEILQLLGQ